MDNLFNDEEEIRTLVEKNPESVRSEITRPVNAEEFLHETEAKFQVLLESAPDAIVIINRDGRIAMVNKRAIEMFGYSQDEFFGQPVEMLVPQDHRSRHAKLRSVFIAEKKARLMEIGKDLGALRKDGAQFPVEIRLSPVETPAGVMVTAIIRDVSERRLASEAAFRLAAIVESSGDAILAKTLDGEITSWNAAAERLYGYPAEEIIGKQVHKLVPASRRAEIDAILEKIRLGERVENLETVRRRKDGSLVDVSLTVSPIYDETGRITGASTVARDFSERKRFELALSESEASFRLMFAGNPLPMWVYDRESFRFLEVNQVAIDHYGYSRSEFLQMRIQDIRLPGELPLLDKQLSKPRPDMQYSGVWHHQLKNGQVIDVEIASHTLTYAGRSAVLVVAQDVTERRQAQERVAFALESERKARARAEETQQRLRFLLEASTLLSELPDYATRLAQVVRLSVPQISDWCSIDLLGEDGKLHRVAVEHIDAAKVELVNRLQERFPADPNAPSGPYHVVKTGKPELYARIDDDLLASSIRDKEQLALIRALGMKSVMIVPLLGYSTTLGIINFVSIREGREYSPDDLELVEDLARRAAQQIENARLYQDTQDLNLELEERVAQRTYELEAANKELEAFSYSVSHDLRAPLRAIDGFSRIVIQEYSPQLPPEAQRYLHLVKENISQMSRLIDDLLTFSRLNRQALRKQPVPPADLARRAYEEVIVGQENRQVAFTIQDLPECHADPLLLKQVFVNLISNALKFTKLRSTAVIEVGCQVTHDVPVYYVKDNGVGFDMQYAPKVFGVFQRLHRVEEYEGTGVGLAIVHRIILRHGGRIWVDAQVDQGATFYFTLEESNLPLEPPRGKADDLT